MVYPLVSVVIVNYNGRELLQKCLKSLSKQKYPNIEIIVVDNNSSDSSLDMISSEFPDVIQVALGYNSYYAEGNNIGFRRAKGKYVMLMNNDVEVEPDFLMPLVEAMERDINIAMCGGKIFLGDRKTINSAGGIIDFYGWNVNRGYLQQDNGQYDISDMCFFAYGAAFMVRKSVIEKTGLFDEKFRFWFDEPDLAFRLHYAGYAVMYVPESVVYHLAEQTVKNVRFNHMFITERNHLRMIIKNYPARYLLRLIPKYAISKSFQLGFYISRLRFSAIVGMAKGWIWNLVNIKDTLKERRKIQTRLDMKNAEKAFNYMIKENIELNNLIKTVIRKRVS